MTNERKSNPSLLAGVREWAEAVRGRGQRTLFWRAWERMLEIEFVDRSVALAGKAFVSFFPLVIVVAAFMPQRVRSSILVALTYRLGIQGHALDIVKQSFASSEDIRQATGILGLVLTFFFASAFTTALQRLYLRAWRRAPAGKVGAYTRGLAWLHGAGLHGAFGRVPRAGGRRCRHWSLPSRLADGDLRAVVVHGLFRPIPEDER